MHQRLPAGLLLVGILASCSSSPSSGVGPDGGGGAGGSPGSGGSSGGTGGVVMPTVAITPVGAASGGATQAMVAPAGGTVTSADGKLKIVVPAGALAAAQMLSIQPITNRAPGGVGPAYRLQPDGQTFTAPVSITFTYDAADVAGSNASDWKIAYQDAMGRWNAVKAATLDAAAMTVTVQTTHFSDWTKLLTLRLKPEKATALPGDDVALVALACEVSTTVAGADPLADLMDTCEPDPTLSTLSGWTANGILGGDAANGTVVSATGVSGTYTAPATAPTPNPVRVSVNALDKAGHTTVLTSEITWLGDLEHASYMGMVTATETNAALGFVTTTTADVTFVWDVVHTWYNVSLGTLYVVRDLNSASCTGHGTYQGNLVPMDGQILINSGTYLGEGSKMVDIVGTVTCGGTPEASTVTDDIKWWPSAIDLFFVQPDGSLQDSFHETNADTGIEVRADSLFVRAP